MDEETQKTLILLLSGKSTLSKRYAGKHVLVIKSKIFPLKDGEDAIKDFEKLKKQYNASP
ncbi:MAG: hypothetical protein HY738_20700, partial [Bacteroidia bacterium]|nr:hypothetical protein [Bacteroidia bacterium]